MIDARNFDDELWLVQRRYFIAEKEFGLLAAAIMLAVAHPPRNLAPEVGGPQRP
jgi:hypothetical protein